MQGDGLSTPLSPQPLKWKDARCKTYLRNWKSGEEMGYHPTHKNYEP